MGTGEGGEGSKGRSYATVHARSAEPQLTLAEFMDYEYLKLQAEHFRNLGTHDCRFVMLPNRHPLMYTNGQ